MPLCPYKSRSIDIDVTNGATFIGPKAGSESSMCINRRKKDCLPLYRPFRKIAFKQRSAGGLCRNSASADKIDPSYGSFLLTFRDSEMEQHYRSLRLLCRTSSSLGISVLFLLVLAFLCPVYGKLLYTLGACKEICLSFTVGYRALIAFWAFHAFIVAFRKKLRVSDKVTIHFTLILIALTLLLALGWANVYMLVYVKSHSQNLKMLPETLHADLNKAKQEGMSFALSSGKDVRRFLFTPTSLDGKMAIPSFSGVTIATVDKAVDVAAVAPPSAPAAAPPPAAAGGAPPPAPAAPREGSPGAAADGMSGGPEVTTGGTAGRPYQRTMETVNFTNHQTHDELHVYAFVMFLITTLSIAAVYSLTEFAPAFLAWSWPLYVVFPILTVATSVVSNVRFRNNLATETAYLEFLLSTVIWGCGFANRYVCEAEQRAEFSFIEEEKRRVKKQLSNGTVDKGTASTTAVEPVQQLADTALHLVNAASLAVAEGADRYTCERHFWQLKTTIAKLSTMLAETDDLYSCKMMHSLKDTAAGQLCHSAILFRSSACPEDYSGSPGTSVAGASIPFQTFQQRHGSKELIHSSCLLEDGPWLKPSATPMISSRRCSGSDWLRLPSEEVSVKPLTCADSPTFLAGAFAAASAGGKGRLRRKSSIENRQPNQTPSLSERNISWPEPSKGECGDTDAAPGLQAAVAPTSRMFSSLARSIFSFNRCHTRRDAAGSHLRNSGRRGASPVEGLFKIEIQPLKDPERAITKYKEFGGDSAGSRNSHDTATNSKQRSFTSPAAFAGIGVDWDIDILGLAENYHGVLQHVGWVLLRPFVNLLGCSSSTVLRLLQQIEARYDQDIPYHTATHAAQVAHSAVVLSTELGVDPAREKMGSFCLGLAAVAHDVGHFGKNNGFLQQSRHRLATIYNDQSIMENFHCSVLFRIVNEIPSANVFNFQSAESYQAIRKQIISLILSTDLKDHVELVSRSRLKRNSPDFSFLQSEEDALLVRTMVLKMADLSHNLLCWKDHFLWVCKIAEELYQQGDEERRLKLPISPLCNREYHQFLAQNQLVFLKLIVEPLFCDLESLEKSTGNQGRRLSFISGTLRKRYENNLERWTILDNSGVYIIFDSETMSRGFYRPSNNLDWQSSEGNFERGMQP